MAGTPILPPTQTQTQKEEKKPRQVSKGLSVKDKNKMCSILGFILYLKESGKMDETEAKRLMEELPLYSISRIQTEFFAQEAFDLKKVEVELWKPMVVENKLDKKNKKQEKEKEKEKKPKKERKQNKKSSSSDTSPVIDTSSSSAPVTEETVVTDTKKRGRKTKKQIIEFKESSSSASEDKLEQLFNDLLEETEEKEKEKEKEKVNEEDLDAVLRELEDGELVEDKITVEEEVLPPPPVKKDKKTNKKEKSEEEKEPPTTTKKQQKKVKIST